MKYQNELIKDNYNFKRHAYISYGEPLVLLCHYYNVSLLAFIEDFKEMVDPYQSLVDNAHTVAYEQLNTAKKELNLNSEETLEFGKFIFNKYGYGQIEFSKTNDSIKFTLPYESFGIGWLSHFGQRNEGDPPIAFFARGFLEALVEVAYDLPKGSVYSKQTKAIEKGDTVTEIKCFNGEPRKLNISPGEGIYEPVVEMKQPQDTTIDYFKIRDAFVNFDIRGSENEGLIDSYEVLVTRMYANYYTLLIRDFIVGVNKNVGHEGMFLVNQLLEEASHKCAFYIIGNILKSKEWNEIVKPQIKNPIDWVHGIVAVLNAFGWGVIQIENFVEDKELALAVYSDYESNSYLKMFEYDEDAKKYLSQEATGYLFKGVASAIMNLLYHGNITRETELTAEVYDNLIRHEDYFIAEQTESRLTGGNRIVCVAKRK